MVCVRSSHGRSLPSRTSRRCGRGQTTTTRRAWRASLTRRKSAWTPTGRTTGRAACGSWTRDRRARRMTSHPTRCTRTPRHTTTPTPTRRRAARTRSEEEADTEEDSVAPITLLPTTTSFDLRGGPKPQEGAEDKGTAGSPFLEEEDFVDVDAGREDGIEDDWVDPVPSQPVAAPAPVKKSKGENGKGKEGKAKKEKRNKTKKAAAVPVPSVHYPFPVSLEDGTSGGGQQQQQRAEERERQRQRNVTVSPPRPPAQRRNEGSACILRARVTGGGRRTAACAVCSPPTTNYFLSFYRCALVFCPYHLVFLFNFFAVYFLLLEFVPTGLSWQAQGR
ncbi:hypothetical protein C8J57DRAFT_329473 [Mycena rebaudengoi]|nr:hypothetical protein C8J57DRAFT_329473 [Mycena rebaudengoi]